MASPWDTSGSGGTLDDLWRPGGRRRSTAWDGLDTTGASPFTQTSAGQGPSTPSGGGIGPYGEGGGFTGGQAPGPSEPPASASSAWAPGPNWNGMRGWDQGKLMDPTHNTLKYQIGRILTNYAPQTGNWDQVMAALKPLGITAESAGSGKIRLPSGEVVDILAGAGQGGTNWWYGNEPGGTPAGADPNQGAMTPENFMALWQSLIGGQTPNATAPTTPAPTMPNFDQYAGMRQSGYGGGGRLRDLLSGGG